MLVLQPLALVHVKRDAFVIVVSEPVVEPHRPLRERQQPLFQRADRDVGLGMGVDDALDVGPAEIDRAMNDDPGVDRLIFGRLDQMAVRNIDFQQVRGGDLVEHQPGGVDQHLVGVARHPRRIMGQYQIVPAEMRDQPVAGGEIDPHRPFFRADMRRPVRDIGFKRVHSFSPSVMCHCEKPSGDEAISSA